MAMKVKLLVGADPELFLRDKKTGKLVAAKIPGTKDNPYKVPYGAIQVDGAAAEFNIDPAQTSSAFITNIAHVMHHMAQHTGPDLEYVLEPTVMFDPDYFKSLPDNVKELGCNPDYNAWTGVVNPAPDRGDKPSMCTASGHLHVGWLTKDVNPFDPLHFEDCQTVIKQMDYYVGLYSLLWDPDNTRRQLYGKAGAFRPKKYGAEYRTPSNRWLCATNIQQWVFGATTKAVQDLLDKGPVIEKKFGEYARKTIDENQTNWMTTKEGKEIHKMTGLLAPDCREVLAYGKPKETPKPRTRKKKADPNHFYEETGKISEGVFMEMVQNQLDQQINQINQQAAAMNAANQQWIIQQN